MLTDMKTAIAKPAAPPAAMPSTIVLASEGLRLPEGNRTAPSTAVSAPMTPPSTDDPTSRRAYRRILPIWLTPWRRRLPHSTMVTPAPLLSPLYGARASVSSDVRQANAEPMGASLVPVAEAAHRSVD
jgi:hypothetical protein